MTRPIEEMRRLARVRDDIPLVLRPADLAYILDAADAMARLLESIDEGSNVVTRWRELGGLS